MYSGYKYNDTVLLLGCLTDLEYHQHFCPIQLSCLLRLVARQQVSGPFRNTARHGHEHRERRLRLRYGRLHLTLAIS